MRPIIPDAGKRSTEPEQGHRKSVTGSVKGSIVHRDLVCLVLAAGIRGVPGSKGRKPRPGMFPCAWFKGLIGI